ncbi:ferrous iron transport protein B [Arachidicoccus rhizosphaerae]|uniref:Ferrous iron transport protein B n=1 Tax=Arachidicoccus rhizosphaerae TaxID=551991 RepID=A0A1H3VEU7_9BACT|nr:ferrous iron transport protein B [Arachidicoccus rhizosphaerae]SDZ73303.1 ferrous iron transport protein B [Arachidicoccus rhizosphaerae]
MLRTGKKTIQIALTGNPNSGKTSLFNALTGLNQKVGNFPGVTVDKKVGVTQISGHGPAKIIDLPGTYSLYPRREDEWVAYRVMMDVEKQQDLDLLLLVMDASNLKRNLLFCSQLVDLKCPVVVALTMNDLAQKKGIRIDVDELSRELSIPVVPVNPRTNKGIPELKKVISHVLAQSVSAPAPDFIDNKALAPQAIEDLQAIMPEVNDYLAVHYLANYKNLAFDAPLKAQIAAVETKNNFSPNKVQAEEILQRYTRIRKIMQQFVVEPDPLQKKIFTDKLDNLLLHRVWGYVILLVVLFVLFQSIFWLASYPMDAIDWGFSELTGWAASVLPDTWWSDLLCNGLLAGLGGIVIFVPQIMILFGLITLLEDSGYMARISFLMDKLMRKVGLNGKSVMPMISGFACAIPGIMSTRNIENKKERLLTIMITPLMSCSARLPVYTILIGLVVPDTYYLGIFSARGLIMMFMYLLGVVMALIVSLVLKWIVKIKEKSFFILELPVYRAPRWKNVGVTMVEKAKIFVLEAGKVIMVISLLIWFLSSYGPSKKMDAVTQRYEKTKTELTQAGPDNTEALEALDREYGTEKLENSYAGLLGKSIEPVIKPLGYDWKIGIALITSFAAREVFVGTMATLYSVDENNTSTLQQKMENAKRPDGSKVYTLATAMSLIIFYVLAMQCMSTLAVVKRETKSWKWPVIQLVYMTALAYVCSWITFELLK